ncbi:MAG: sigma-70 family RNA polymerase sigma factor [Ruminococcus sp.]|nr:sigma-70 family RNA polymerase sigma factor [Ruminococcus sp.]
MAKNIDVNLINHIVNTYSDTILRIAYQYTQSIYDSQDIAQDVFLAIMKKDISALSEEKLKAYIIRATINKCNDFHRKKSRRKVISLEDAEPVFTPEEQNVLDEVNSLPEKYRNVIYLHYYEGYRVNEIAEILGAKPSTISSQLSRARAKLKDYLTEESYENL